MKNLLSKVCVKMIRHARKSRFQGKITYEQSEDKIFFWQTILHKWVYDECHHLCCFCDFKYECWSNAKEK